MSRRKRMFLVGLALAMLVVSSLACEGGDGNDVSVNPTPESEGLSFTTTDDTIDGVIEDTLEAGEKYEEASGVINDLNCSLGLGSCITETID